jgi:hypothetical protein
MGWFWNKPTSNVARAFGKFLSREDLRRLESIEGKRNELPPLKMERVYYVVFQVRDDSFENIQRDLVQALEILFSRGGVVECIMSSTASVTFKPNSMQEHPVDALLDSLGSCVRAVYGRGEYPRGMFGIPGALTFGTILPNFNKTLEILGHLEFGSSKELDMEWRA